MNRLKIATRLVISYVVIISIFLAVILFSDYSNTQTAQTHQYLYDYVNDRHLLIWQYHQQLTEMRRLLRSTFMDRFWMENATTDEMIAAEEEVEAVYRNLMGIADIYAASVLRDPVLTPQQAANLQDIITRIAGDTTGIFAHFESHFFVGGDGVQGMGDIIELNEYIQEDIQELLNFTYVRNSELREDLYFQATLLRIVLYSAAGFSIVLAAVLAFLIIRNFNTRMGTMLNSARRVQNGDFEVELRNNDRDELAHLSNNMAGMVDKFKILIQDIEVVSKEFELGDIEAKLDESKFQGGYKETAKIINTLMGNAITDILDVLAAAKSYAEGDFDVKFKTMPGKKIIATDTLNLIRTNLHNVYNDITKLANFAADGDLTKKVELDAYSGDWKSVMGELNRFVSAVANPINESTEILKKLANGDLSASVTGSYKGSFLEIKEALNSAIMGISSYIKEINDVLTSMSESDLNVNIDREYVGEFNNIKLAINKIIATFNEVLGEIQVSTVHIASGAEAIARSSQDLSSGTMRQAEEVDRVQTTIADMLVQIESNAEKADMTSKVSENAKESAFRGNNDMQEMLSSMEEINRASDNISKVIKVIDDIAFQTNLLSLNASVEAARAGEHGKGFAVVAEEVRTLAGRSKQAAEETSLLIESSVEKTKEGSRIANQTADTLSEIVSQVDEISGLIREVAIASEAQATAVQNVQVSIREISDVTQIAAATSQETASTSEELSSQSETFKNMVGGFKVKGV
ncbi:MAG: methyl-accepting chemotaxis protein [Turicibacter sp.]|nr:methyl-accepting chemotaxis protein [Turicibacter sp.]